MKVGYFSKKIAEWYHEHHRNLPWRETRDPYKIWLSEIILQQTRVIQGLPYYERFIKSYPSIKALAAAREQDVLRLWQGLGYYTRARNLHACAKTIVKQYKGKFPQTFHELRLLPGIGTYTAAAIASFAFDEPVAVVDGNVQRVLARIFGIDKDVASSEGKHLFFETANRLIPRDSPAVHNQAVMEFGALHCVPVNPSCEECVFKKECFAYQHDSRAQLPVKKKKKKITKRFFYYFLLKKKGKLMMVERQSKDIWKGLHDFPLHEHRKAAPPLKVLSDVFADHASAANKITVSKDYTHILTHQVIKARFIELDISPEAAPSHLLRGSKARWYTLQELEKIPKPVLISRFLADRFSV